MEKWVTFVLLFEDIIFEKGRQLLFHFSTNEMFPVSGVLYKAAGGEGMNH